MKETTDGSFRRRLAAADWERLMQRFLFSQRQCRWLAALAGGMLWCALSAWALDPAKSIFHFNVQNWTRQNGLPADKIGAITQTNDGYIWLGTQNGLVRFDGLEFEAVRIALEQAHGEDVASLDQARDGGLWFAIRSGGFGRFDGRRFSPIEDARWWAGDVAALQIVEAEDGAVWTGAHMGLGRWKQGHAEETVFDEPVGNVLWLSEEPGGRIWIGTSENGVSYREDGKSGEIADDELKTLNVYGVVRDRSGDIWVGTNRGLRRYDADGRWKEHAIVDLYITTLLVDSHGVLWVGTNGSGLGRLEGGEVKFLTKVDGLGSDSITALFEDREGSVWVGTLDGLSQLSDLKFPIYSREAGLPAGSTQDVAASRAGGVWLATAAGASHFDAARARNYNGEPLLPNPYVRRIFEARNGDVYVGDGDRNINVWSDGRLVARYTTTEWTEAMAEDDESVLLTVGGNLKRVKDGRVEPYRFNPGQEPELGWINSMIVSRDNAIWLGSHAGVVRVKDGDVQRWLTAEGLTSDRIHCLAEDEDGSIWVGLPTGMARIKDGTVRSIGEANGLHDARVYAIVPDDQGNFWCASGRGIFRVAVDELKAVADGRAKMLRSEAFDGLESVKFADRTEQGFSGAKSRDGRIWFPNPHGVVMIDPVDFHRNEVPPPVQIQQVRVDGGEVEMDGPLVLEVGAKRVEFSFAALSYVAPKKVQVQYRLEGVDREWVDAAGRRTALYNGLRPGDYAFEVRAANADGVWSASEARLEFKLPPPFYRTAWFYAMCGLLAGANLWGAYRWKVRRMEVNQKRLREQNELLEAKVSERTEELAYERDLLRTLLDNSADNIYFKDAQSRFIKVSLSLAKTVGRNSTDEVLGRTDFDFHTEESARQRFAEEQEIMRTGQPLIAKVEEEIWLDGRKPTWCITSKLPLRNKDNEIVGTFGISKDITAMKESQAKLDEAHKQLLEISRFAGMAEVATSVLHNVGNVLNSVNVSATLLGDQLRRTKASQVAKLAALFEQHQANLGEFVTNDPRGRMIPDYLKKLSDSLAEEQKAAKAEVEQLQKNVEHIKEIVAMQQAYARPSGVMETIGLVELVEDSLRINSGSLARHEVEVQCEFEIRPTITTDKHKVIQILINLIRNAEHACVEGRRTKKRITVRTTAGEGCVKIEVIDNGVGIRPENLTRIFQHGFTTRAHGHGFGLHSGALAAKELGGALRVSSDGPGRGAVFTLELPVKSE